MMFSHGCAGSEDGIEEQGHASPRDTPSIWVRVLGQILASPLIRTFQRVGTVTIGTDDACVDG